ncbi:extracellular solute-binding protein [Paenibacillus sp. IB182496]|uniref:Extracellular solute-binding protein n=1 Tax=Paenibacillus sabuli TaxID=2772509 RepID=A0A927GQ10_9BACL|nr:extracellular solute-binding protein [Paenibacillus sabuli]MBD2844034.1 extracellular solute-binding protein [Paenibacillus sabuli]
MKTKMLWRFKFVVVAALIMVWLGGCSGEENTKNNQGAQSNQSGEQNNHGDNVATTGEPDELTIYAYNDGIGLNDGAIKYIEEKTNTKLNITTGIGEEMESKLNVMLASGDIPDIIQYQTDETELKYAGSGILLPLNEYFDKAPQLEASRSEEVWQAMTHADGNIYTVGIQTPSVHFVTMYRKDWLDKLKLEVPTTIDEYYAVADAVSNGDPDGNGKKDTYAFGASGELGRYFDHVFGAFGVLPDYWMERDGRIVNGTVQPEAKEALLFLNKMYENGLIDPEFITDDGNRNKNKFKAGVYGAQANFIWVFDSNNLNNYYTPFKEANPNGEWIEGPVLKGPGTESVGMRMLSQRGWLKTSITKDSKNIDAALRLLDWLASEEGNRFVNYGLEGEHYQVDEKGIIKKTVEVEEAKKYGIDKFVLAKSVSFDTATPRFLEVKDFTEKNALSEPADGILVPEIGKFGKDLKAYTNTEYLKMIVGEMDIDKEFDKFVQEWNDRGGKEFTDALNAAYQERK